MEHSVRAEMGQGGEEQSELLGPVHSYDNKDEYNAIFRETREWMKPRPLTPQKMLGAGMVYLRPWALFLCCCLCWLAFWSSDGRVSRKLTTPRAGEVSQLGGGTVSQGYPEIWETRNHTSLRRDLFNRDAAAPRGGLPQPLRS